MHPTIKFIIAPKYDDYENIVPTPIINNNPQPLEINYIQPDENISKEVK